MNARQPTSGGWIRQAPAGRVSDPSAAPEIAHCDVLAEVVPFDRVAMTLASGVDEMWLLRGSDPALEDLIQQEQTVLQGPNTDVLAAGFPITVDRAASWGSRWPLLMQTQVLGMVPYGSLLAVPVGASSEVSAIGTLCVARDHELTFTHAESDEVARFATVLADQLLARWASVRDVDRFEGLMQDQRHLAAGMLASFLGMPTAQALAVMRARAFAEERTLADLAAEIVAELGPSGSG